MAMSINDSLYITYETTLTRSLILNLTQHQIDLANASFQTTNSLRVPARLHRLSGAPHKMSTLLG